MFFSCVQVQVVFQMKSLKEFDRCYRFCLNTGIHSFCCRPII